MKKETAADLVAFLAVAREQSFTRAAALLGVSQSALSQTMRGLESRLGVRLLTRTTRRVSVTEAGERLLRTVGPRFEEIDGELEAVTSLREKPAGTIRLTATENAAASVLRANELGTIEAGKLADMVIIDGDPLADVRALLRVVTTIKEGVVVSEHASH